MLTHTSVFIEEEFTHNPDTCVEFDQDCAECVLQRQEANRGTVPLSVVEVRSCLLRGNTCSIELGEGNSCFSECGQICSECGGGNIYSIEGSRQN